MAPEPLEPVKREVVRVVLVVRAPDPVVERRAGVNDEIFAVELPIKVLEPVGRGVAVVERDVMGRPSAQWKKFLSS